MRDGGSYGCFAIKDPCLVKRVKNGIRVSVKAKIKYTISDICNLCYNKEILCFKLNYLHVEGYSACQYAYGSLALEKAPFYEL